MTLYVVAYEKNDGVEDAALVARLKSFEGAYSPFDTLWLVRSNLSVSDLRDVLARQCDTPRRILVLKYVPHNEMALGAAAWSGFSEGEERHFFGTL